MSNDLEQMYQQIILDASKQRHGEGLLDDPQGESFQVNPTCGDQVKLQVRLSDDGESLTEIGWEGDGCSISQASISILNDLTAGKSVEEVSRLYDTFHHMMNNKGEPITDEEADLLEDASAFEGVSKFPVRIKCALLGWMALRDATDEALEKVKEN